ncbi:hypothetical protein KR067_009722, partial [Drosophila pandora]
NLGDTTPGEEEDFGGSTSPTSIIDQTTDRLINGDLRKGARVEPLPGRKPTTSGDEQYDVIDVLESTGTVVGKPKSGQTTRIYTTGEVDENFWLKHLGDDFRHAIHLQVGGTNEEYNRLINQTQNGVHEEVHHEYLPGAERPGADPQSGYGRGQNFDNRAVASKQQYLRQRQHKPQRYNYAQQYTPNTQQQQQQHQHTPHQHQHPQQQQQYQPQRNMRYPQKSQPQPQRGYIINSSEDQLHAAQSNPSPVRSSSAGGGGPVPGEERESFGSQLPFKSPFNDYGSRPTRDLTYLLYKRGL